MKKILFAALFLGISSSFALADEAYLCKQVNQVPEWVFEINLASGKAAFFDNDQWEYFTIKGTLPIKPPEIAYVFQGKTQILEFNKTEGEAEIINSKGSVEYSSTACGPIPASELSSGI